MKKLLITTLMVLSLSACESGDTTSDDVDLENSDIELKVTMELHQQQGANGQLEYAMVMKVQPIEDNGLQSFFIKISDSDLFFMDINGRSFDLTSHFDQTSSLTGLSQYKLEIAPFSEAIEEIEFELYIDNRAFRAKYYLDQALRISSNSAGYAGFDPRYDVLDISWVGANLPLQVDIEQSIATQLTPSDDVLSNLCALDKRTVNTQPHQTISVTARASYLPCAQNPQDILYMGSQFFVEQETEKLRPSYSSFASSKFKLTQSYLLQHSWQRQ
ncbi:hypothetical protein [Thalassotalea sp. Y01]|uniref:hypothetical protein n=1 Tax=Thalassotalea sp. Y01 TaxID=2729613 RepID=UPI00145E2786|nr:hypothetical protein [Thalassotalea sp. Y01]NMP16409.1 hypothetical protein [Thalassotalea sp. Y01]